MQFMWVAVIIFVVAVIQSVAGFGTALVGMPLLVTVVGFGIASPLVAMIGLTLEAVILIRYHADVNFTVVWRLILAAVVGVPLGILAIKRLDEQLVLTLLGVIIVAYAIYGLLNLTLPHLEGNGWAYLAGFLSGVLGGAYNTAGPPVAIYGNCRRWPPDVFRGNLQGFFLAVDLVVVANHTAVGNVTRSVLQAYAVSLIPLFAGFLVGTALAKRVAPAVFSRIVLVMLVLVGLRLVF